MGCCSVPGYNKHAGTRGSAQTPSRLPPLCQPLIHWGAAPHLWQALTNNRWVTPIRERPGDRARAKTGWSKLGPQLSGSPSGENCERSADARCSLSAPSCIHTHCTQAALLLSDPVSLFPPCPSSYPP